MARYPNKATYRTWVRDSKTGEWKQIDPKDIPQDKINELCDNSLWVLDIREQSSHCGGLSDKQEGDR